MCTEETGADVDETGMYDIHDTSGSRAMKPSECRDHIVPR